MDLQFFRIFALTPPNLLTCCIRGGCGSNLFINIYNMENRNVILKFDTKHEEDAVNFDKFTDEVVRKLGVNKNSKVKVFIKNKIDVREMNRIVEELCDIIKYKFSYIVKYSRQDEHIAKDSSDILLSVTYCIECHS